MFSVICTWNYTCECMYWIQQGWFFQLFNWFQLLFCEKEIPKIAENSQNRSKTTFLKAGVDDFSYFIDFQLFYILYKIIPDIVPLFCFIFRINSKLPTMKSNTYHFKKGSNQLFSKSSHIVEPNKYYDEEVIF